MGDARRSSSTKGKRLKVRGISPRARGDACRACRARKVRCHPGTPACRSCTRQAVLMKADPALMGCDSGGAQCGAPSPPVHVHKSPEPICQLLPAYEVAPSLSPAAYPDYSYTMPTERRGSAASIDSLQSNDTYSSFSSSYNSPAPYFHHHSPVHHVYETQEPCAPSPYWLAAPTPWSHSHSHLTPYPGSPIDYLPPLQSTSLPSSSFHTYASLSSDVLSCNLPPHIPHRPSAPLSRRVQWGMVETPSEPRPLLISHLSEPSSNWNPRDELGRRPLSWSQSWSQSTFGHEGLYPGETYS